MTSKIEIYTYNNYPDFKIGKLNLAVHLDVGKSIGVLSVDKRYAKQLLLKEASELESGRIPLYVCECCADLGCGAITVLIEQKDGCITWSDFRSEGYAIDEAFQSEYMKRTGPFYFDKEEYFSAILPYSK